MKITLALILIALTTGCAFTPYTAQEIAQIEASRQRHDPAMNQGIYQGVGEEMRWRSTQGR